LTLNEEKDVKLVPNSSLKELLEKAAKESEAASAEVGEETDAEEPTSKTEEVKAEESTSKTEEAPVEEVKAEESSTEKSEE
jgi:hypothetical protein